MLVFVAVAARPSKNNSKEYLKQEIKGDKEKNIYDYYCTLALYV